MKVALPCIIPTTESFHRTNITKKLLPASHIIHHIMLLFLYQVAAFFHGTWLQVVAAATVVYLQLSAALLRRNLHLFILVLLLIHAVHLEFSWYGGMTIPLI